MNFRKEGLAIHCIALVACSGVRKVTQGITEWSQLRVHIDIAACFLDVVFSYPPVAAGWKGWAVRPVTGNMRWVRPM